MDDLKKETNYICKKCASSLPADACFCPVCGVSVTATECRFCGFTINAYQKYCTQCGADSVFNSRLYITEG